MKILEDLTCLEGLMKMKRKLDLGLKAGTLNSPQVNRKAQLLA
jgi:succinylarginine dihydrolase